VAAQTTQIGTLKGRVQQIWDVAEDTTVVQILAQKRLIKDLGKRVKFR
jgi:hypothetical protein